MWASIAFSPESIIIHLNFAEMICEAVIEARWVIIIDATEGLCSVHVPVVAC